MRPKLITSVASQSAFTDSHTLPSAQGRACAVFQRHSREDLRGRYRSVPAQNKVLAIMRQGNLLAQAYRRTGCVSDSRAALIRELRWTHSAGSIKLVNYHLAGESTKSMSETGGANSEIRVRFAP